MRKMIYLFFSIIILPVILYSNEPKFQKSLEQEFDDVIMYYAACKKQSFENVKGHMLARKQKYASTLSSVDEIIKNCKKNNKKDEEDLFLDLKITFDFLKKKMGIAREVDLVFCDDPSLQGPCGSLMSYDLHDRMVYIHQNFWDLSPTNIVFTMIHELTHAQQHMRKGSVNFIIEGKDKAYRAQIEREADINAAQIVNCPLCLKVVLAHRLSEEALSTDHQNEKFRKLGYLTSDQLRNYLQQKSLINLCKVHKHFEDPDVWLGLDTQQGREMIDQEDYEGTIFDRVL
ncbi:hypothetical protein HYV10_04410 [Candidatus Dependentiae bacterium]|nr:hypothetical protein [Candidatus Dependentiae bacterium]